MGIGMPDVQKSCVFTHMVNLVPGLLCGGGGGQGTAWAQASYPGPAQLSVACSMEMQKQLGGSGDAPPENFGIFELPSSILGLL